MRSRRSGFSRWAKHARQSRDRMSYVQSLEARKVGGRMADVDPYELAPAEADSPLQHYGYVRSYRAVVRSCGVMEAYLYGILEDFSQVGARTKKGSVPSHARLAELMDCS